MLANTYTIPMWLIFITIICFILVLAFAIWLSSMIAYQRGYDRGVTITRIEKRRKIREDNLQKYPQLYNVNSDVYDEINKSVRLIKRNTNG